MATSLETYRALYPAHAGVAEGTISAWLEAAARRHNSAAFGAVYVDALCAWAAAHIDYGVQTGAIPLLGSGGDICGPLLPVETEGKAKPTKPEESPYWATYLDYVRSRSSTGPMRVGPGRCSWPY
jgi:hypothetical protein